MENQEQYQPSQEELESEIVRIEALVAAKYEGRAAMVAQGIAVEPEADDYDLRDLTLQLSEAKSSLAQLRAFEQDMRIDEARQMPL